jgi:hypothetical protein
VRSENDREEGTHLKSHHPPHRIPLAFPIKCLTRHHYTPRIASFLPPERNPPIPPKAKNAFYRIADRISTAPRIRFMPVARRACISTRSPSVSPHLEPPSRTHVRPHPHAHTTVLFTVRTWPKPQVRIGAHSDGR